MPDLGVLFRISGDANNRGPNGEGKKKTSKKRMAMREKLSQRPILLSRSGGQDETTNFRGQKNETSKKKGGEKPGGGNPPASTCCASSTPREWTRRTRRIAIHWGQKGKKSGKRKKRAFEFLNWKSAPARPPWLRIFRCT